MQRQDLSQVSSVNISGSQKSEVNLSAVGNRFHLLWSKLACFANQSVPRPKESA